MIIVELSILLPRQLVTHSQAGSVFLWWFVQNRISILHGCSHDCTTDGHTVVATRVTPDDSMQITCVNLGKTQSAFWGGHQFLVQRHLKFLPNRLVQNLHLCEVVWPLEDGCAIIKGG
ncbi:MAG: hypothetical protein WCL16_00745, partial [bacterium]